MSCRASIRDGDTVLCNSRDLASSVGILSVSATAESPNRTRPENPRIGLWALLQGYLSRRDGCVLDGERPILAGERAKGFADCTPWRFIKAMREARRGKYNLIIVYMPLRPAWHPRYWLRAFSGKAASPALRDDKSVRRLPATICEASRADRRSGYERCLHRRLA